MLTNKKISIWNKLYSSSGSTPPVIPTASNLIALYALDEATGNDRLDSSANALHLTETGIVTNGPGVSGNAAVFSGSSTTFPNDSIIHYRLNGEDPITRIGGNDLVFGPECAETIGQKYDGSTQYENADIDSSLVAIGTGAFSVAFWIKTTGTDMTVFGNGLGDNADTFRVRVNADGMVSLKTFNTDIPCDLAINDDNWHHIIIVSTESWAQLGIYVDGTLTSLDGAKGYNLIDSGVFTVGKATDNTEYFNGSLDGIRFYDRIIAAGEVIDFSNFRCDITPFPCLSHPYNPKYDLTNTDFTVTGWFKPDITDSQVIVYLGNGGILAKELVFLVVFLSPNILRFVVSDGVSSASVDSPVIATPTDQYTFFACRYTNSTKLLELRINDGSFSVQFSTVTPQNPGNQVFRLGSSVDISNPLKGSIDKISLSSELLTDEFIESVYNGTEEPS